MVEVVLVRQMSVEPRAPWGKINLFNWISKILKERRRDRKRGRKRRRGNGM